MEWNWSFRVKLQYSINFHDWASLHISANSWSHIRHGSKVMQLRKRSWRGTYAHAYTHLKHTYTTHAPTRAHITRPHPLTQSPTHPLTHSSTHPLTHSLTHSLTHPHSSTHTLTGTLSLTATHSLSHSHSLSLSLSLSHTHTHTHTHTWLGQARR